MTPQRGPRRAPEAAPPRPEDSPPPEDAAARLLPRPSAMPASESLAAGSRMVRVSTEAAAVDDPAAACSWDSDAARLLKMVDVENLEGLQALLESGVHVNGHGGTFHETALHRAAQVRWAAGVRFLLAAGASVYAKNQFGQTPLHYAAASKSTMCIQLLLENRRPGVVDHRDMRGHTPLHDAAAAGCVNALSLLLKAGALVRAKDGTGSTPLHKAARARSVPCMVALLDAGADMAAADDNGETVLAYTLHYMPGLMDTVFDECLVTNSPKINTKTLEVTMNFLPLCCASDKNLNQVQNLQSFVDLGHAKLLSHPLCETFLLLKWMNVKRLFLIEVILYLLFSVLTTVLTFNKFVWTPDANELSTIRNTTPINTNTTDPDAKNASSGEAKAPGPCKDDPEQLSVEFNQTLRVAVVIYLVLIILQQALSMLQNKLQWFRSLSAVLHVVITVLVAVVVLPDVTTGWQQHLASWLMLLLWTECMLLIGRFPNCGVYVVMFTRVAKVFLRIFLMYFCLLLAFTAAFYVALNFQRECAPDKKDPVLDSPMLTFVKTLTMMIGELDFGDEFVNGLSKLPFTGHSIFFIFIILVSIILSNLLVALAVSDVQGLRNSAHLERLIKQTELVFHMEKNFSTAAYIASHIKFSKLKNLLDKVALICTYDCYNTRVFYLPNSPLKSNKLFIVKNKTVKETSVPSYLLANVNRCLRGREADQHCGGGGGGDTGKSFRAARRGSRIRRGDYQKSDLTSNDEVKSGLKELEEIVSDRMEEVRDSYTGLQRQMEDLEEKLKRITSLLAKDEDRGDDSGGGDGGGGGGDGGGGGRGGRGGGGGGRRRHIKLLGPNLSLPDGVNA